MTIANWPNAKRSLDAYDLSGKQALVLGAASGAGRAIALDQRLAVPVENPLLEPAAPTVAPRQQPVAGGRANGGRCMGVGERHPVGGEAVDARREDCGVRVQRPDVSVTHVIGQDEYDVRSAGGKQTSRTSGE